MKSGGLIGLISSIVLSAAVAGYVFINSTKTAYVEITEVYNDFVLKKELEAKLDNLQQARKSIIDSLELQLKFASDRIMKMEPRDSKKQKEIELFEQQRQEFLYKKKNFDEDNQMATQQYSDQIWKQLNQYIKDDGNEKGYDYIFGADGTGSLMFAGEENNVTREVKEYVNKKYTGGILEK